jgi:hypothetical protein
MIRKKPNRTEQLAATLRLLFGIPYEHAKAMSDEQLISLFDWHHNIRVAEGGTNDHWNIEPILRAEHRERTRKIDVPEIAKNKRVASAHQEHMRRMAEAKEPGRSAHVPSPHFRRR